MTDTLYPGAFDAPRPSPRPTDGSGARAERPTTPADDTCDAALIFALSAPLECPRDADAP